MVNNCYAFKKACSCYVYMYRDSSGADVNGYTNGTKTGSEWDGPTEGKSELSPADEECTHTHTHTDHLSRREKERETKKTAPKLENSHTFFVCFGSLHEPECVTNSLARQQQQQQRAKAAT